MGIFQKFFKSGKIKEERPIENNKQNSYICEIARMISSNNSDVMEKINFCVSNTSEYIKVNSQLYENAYGDINNYDTDTLCWLGLVEELADIDYLYNVDYKCELEDFLWALKQIKTYNLIDIDISSLNLSENEDVESWGEEINTALEGRACICTIDIDSDSYDLIIVSGDVYEKISKIAESNGHSIEIF